MFIKEQKQKLNKSVIPSKIYKAVEAVEGVASFDLTSPQRLEADIKTFYVGSINNLTFKRAS